MKRLMIFCVSLLALMTLVACGTSTLDTSNEKAYKKSFSAIYESLSEQDRKAFLDYFNIVIRGNVIDLNAETRGVVTYEQALGLFERLQSMWNLSGRSLQVVNGLTAAEIISQGKIILKKEIEDELIVLKSAEQEQENVLDEIKKLQTAHEKVSVEIINPAQVKVKKAQMGGFNERTFTVSVVIKNDSSFTITGFANSVKLFKNDEELHFMSLNFSELSVDEKNGPFSYDGEGLAPGKTVKCEIKYIITGNMDYTSTAKYNIKLMQDKLAPKFKSNYHVNDYNNTQKRLKMIKNKISTLNAELAKI